jgi:conjugal transfer pilus assembly protein TraF
MTVKTWVAWGAFLAVLLISGALQKSHAQNRQEVREEAVAPSDGRMQPRSKTWFDESPWREDRRAFHYYPDPEDRQARPPEPKPKSLQDMKTIEEFRAEVERLKGVAIMDPSEQNVSAYLFGNKLMMDKASYFTDQWRRVVWKTPELDFNKDHPTANAAAMEARRMEEAEREVRLAELGKSNGLLYFFRSDCALCKLQAPALLAFSRRYNIDVLPVSLDGKIPPNFPLPKPRLDNGVSQVVTNGEGVNSVPALFLVSHDTKQVDPLGVGVIAVEDIAERIRVVKTTQLGDDYIRGRARPK